MRTKKVVEESTKNVYEEVAEIIHGECMTPGCAAKYHMSEAKLIITRLRELKYITKDEV